MELATRGELEEALQVFQELVDRKPDYVPVYLMYGNLLAQSGEKERAAGVFRCGAEVARAAGDGKARDENLGALAELVSSE
jgi:predicted Zn-dependent protease